MGAKDLVIEPKGIVIASVGASAGATGHLQKAGPQHWGTEPDWHGKPKTLTEADLPLKINLPPCLANADSPLPPLFLRDRLPLTHGLAWVSVTPLEDSKDPTDENVRKTFCIALPPPSETQGKKTVSSSPACGAQSRPLLPPVRLLK